MLSNRRDRSKQRRLRWQRLCRHISPEFLALFPRPDYERVECWRDRTRRKVSIALFVCRRKSSLNPPHKFCCRFYRVTERHFSCWRRTPFQRSKLAAQKHPRHEVGQFLPSFVTHHTILSSSLYLRLAISL